jgi:hypothetical protein
MVEDRKEIDNYDWNRAEYDLLRKEMRDKQTYSQIRDTFAQYSRFRGMEIRPKSRASIRSAMKRLVEGKVKFKETYHPWTKRETAFVTHRRLDGYTPEEIAHQYYIEFGYQRTVEEINKELVNNGFPEEGTAKFELYPEEQKTEVKEKDKVRKMVSSNWKGKDNRLNDEEQLTMEHINFIALQHNLGLKTDDIKEEFDHKFKVEIAPYIIMRVTHGEVKTPVRQATKAEMDNGSGRYVPKETVKKATKQELDKGMEKYSKQPAKRGRTPFSPREVKFIMDAMREKPQYVPKDIAMAYEKEYPNRRTMASVVSKVDRIKRAGLVSSEPVKKVERITDTPAKKVEVFTPESHEPLETVEIAPPKPKTVKRVRNKGKESPLRQFLRMQRDDILNLPAPFTANTVSQYYGIDPKNSTTYTVLYEMYEDGYLDKLAADESVTDKSKWMFAPAKTQKQKKLPIKKSKWKKLEEPIKLTATADGRVTGVVKPTKKGKPPKKVPIMKQLRNSKDRIMEIEPPLTARNVADELGFPEHPHVVYAILMEMVDQGYLKRMVSPPGSKSKWMFIQVSYRAGADTTVKSKDAQIIENFNSARPQTELKSEGMMSKAVNRIKRAFGG